MRTLKVGLDRRYYVIPAVQADLTTLKPNLTIYDIIFAIDINFSDRRTICGNIENLFEIDIADNLGATLVCNDELSKVAVVAINQIGKTDVQLHEIGSYARIIRFIMNIMSHLG